MYFLYFFTYWIIHFEEYFYSTLWMLVAASLLIQRISYSCYEGNQHHHTSSSNPGNAAALFPINTFACLSLPTTQPTPLQPHPALTSASKLSKYTHHTFTALSAHKYLGLYLDNKLDWSAHTDGTSQEFGIYKDNYQTEAL